MLGKQRIVPCWKQVKQKRGWETMDPISMIETALVAGAAASSQETASQAVKDAYSGLKHLVSRLFAAKPRAQQVLADHEQDPEIYEKPLKKWLGEVGAEQDADLLATAKHLLTLVQPQQAGMGKFSIQNNAPVQGQIIGDHTTNTQHFGEMPKA
jgi:hypothetical protein